MNPQGLTILKNPLARYVTTECYRDRHDRCSGAIPLRDYNAAWPCTCKCHKVAS